jgi:hypothetical protein
MAQDADLTTVLVDLDRQSDRFHARRLTYGFASSKGKTRVFAIAVDNTMHQAFGAMDSPDNPNNSQMPASALQPLDLSRVAKEITEVLEVAKTNGLAEFCLLTPPKSGNVDLGLRNSGTGPVWYVTGDGWDDKGPIAEIHISIDARTGAVLSLSLEKAVGRP